MNELKNVLIKKFSEKKGISLSEGKIQLETIISKELVCIDEEKIFDEMLDDIYGFVKIATYNYQVSKALKIIDSIAYRELLLNYFDSLKKDCSEMENYYELNGELYNISNVHSLVEDSDD